MRAAAFLAAILCVAGVAAAQPASLAQDVEGGVAGVRGADPYGFVEMDGVLYYAASDVEHGFELWRSDGSAAGTHVVADVQPGPVGSMPRELTVVGGTLFFIANDGTSGFALWASDGTGAGTRLLRAVGAAPDDPSEQMSFPGQLTAFGATLLFTARGAGGSPALWRSDGTPAGTHQAVLLGADQAFATPRQPLAVAGDTAWFMTRNKLARGQRQRVLWRTDGSAAGTRQVWTGSGRAGVCCGALGELDLYAAFGAALLFRGAGPNGNEALWRTDGTPGGTFVLASSPTGDFRTGGFTQVGATMYFVAGGGTPNPPTPAYQELWRTDGTPEGTSLVAPFGSIGVGRLASAAGRVFFVSGAGLGVSDGTPEGTRMLVSASSFNDIHVAGAGDHAVFVGEGRVGVSDGTLAGTSVVRNGLTFPWGFWIWGELESAPLGPNPALTCFAGRCALRARRSGDPSSPWGQRRHELWLSDGTVAGTQPVLSRAGRSRGSWPEQFVGLGSTAYFTTALAHEPFPVGNDDVRLVATDGTPAGTTTVMSWANAYDCAFWPDGSEDCRLHGLTPVAGRMFFFRGRVSAFAELWASDGTTAGTRQLRTGFSSDPLRRGSGAVAGRFVFSDGTQIWSSDGTEAGTLAIGAPAGGLGTNDLQFTLAGGALFFASPSALYKTDGTPGSVQLVKALAAAELTDAGGTLYFSSQGELWRSDGTEAGTLRVAATQHTTRLTAAGTRVFFTARDAAHGTELWVSDGTAGGTQRVADLRGGAESSEPDALTADGARLFFTANNGAGGRELWVTDGTREGTRPVADIAAGAASGLAEGPLLVADGGRVYFPAYTPATGVELWSSDGTPQGTALVQDIAPGAASSNPRELAVVAGRLYFSADEGVHGQEPWSLPLTYARK